MEQSMEQDTTSFSQNGKEDLIIVDNLIKYFPIRGGFLQRVQQIRDQDRCDDADDRHDDQKLDQGKAAAFPGTVSSEVVHRERVSADSVPTVTGR